MLISEEQYWRYPAKKLEELEEEGLQGWQEKTQSKEKLKLVLISQVYD